MKDIVRENASVDIPYVSNKMLRMVRRKREGKKSIEREREREREKVPLRA